MRVVVQRVTGASLSIDGRKHAEIGKGMVVLLGITDDDTEEDAAWLISKLTQLRIFADAEGVMNLAVKETGGDILLVSQFTLYASTKKGNRPSYIKAARPEKALPLYQVFIDRLGSEMSKPLQTGEFGADMQVSLTNDGPVTILIDSRNRE